MDYEKSWKELRIYVEQLKDVYVEATLMSMAESIHGEKACKNILSAMDSILESNKLSK